MRVVYDYGLAIGGARSSPSLAAPGAGAENGHEVIRRGGEPVMIIRSGAAARTKAELAGATDAVSLRDVSERPTLGAPAAEERTGPSALTDEGLRISVAGQDWLLTVSDAALNREQSVRLHEQAHARTLGAYAASAIAYQTQRGPDGQQYVTGGSIRADLSEVPGDPRATLRKARTVMAAAHAVGDPSTADMRVAAQAYRMAQSATEELREIASA